jgi:uncharacterized protein
MHPMISQHLSEISALCRQFGVARLDLFGSCAGDAFEPERSDVDLVVEFLPEARQQAFDNYFGLKENLQALLGREVDIVTESSIRNPYLRQSIDASRRKLYGS